MKTVGFFVKENDENIYSAGALTNSSYRERKTNWLKTQGQIVIEQAMEDTFCSPHLYKVANGIIVIDEAKVAEQQVKDEEERKQKHEASAYAQQKIIFNENKKAIFDAVVYNAPPADMSLLPKFSAYRNFMLSLWTEYHTRIAIGSVDYDYSLICPAQEYSYIELEQEWASYNNL